MLQTERQEKKCVVNGMKESKWSLIRKAFIIETRVRDCFVTFVVVSVKKAHGIHFMRNSKKYRKSIENRSKSIEIALTYHDRNNSTSDNTNGRFAIIQRIFKNCKTSIHQSGVIFRAWIHLTLFDILNIIATGSRDKFFAFQRVNCPIDRDPIREIVHSAARKL